MAREALQVIIRLAGQAPSRFRPLSSNVRHQGKLLSHPSFHEYEAQLAEQRARIAIEGDEIVARFSHVYRFPLSTRDTFEHAVAQARVLAIHLLGTHEDFYDLPLRLLQLAAEFHGWHIDYWEAYMPHSIVVLPRIARMEQRSTDGRRHIDLSSEDGQLFLELSRSMHDGQLFGPVHIEWPKIGFAGDNERQFGDISSLEIQKTLEHLVFSFPSDTKWGTTRPTPEDSEYYWNRGTRLALEVHWDGTTECAAVEAVARLMHGLTCTINEAECLVVGGEDGLDPKVMRAKPDA